MDQQAFSKEKDGRRVEETGKLAEKTENADQINLLPNCDVVTDAQNFTQNNNQLSPSVHSSQYIDNYDLSEREHENQSSELIKELDRQVDDLSESDTVKIQDVSSGNNDDKYQTVVEQSTINEPEIMESEMVDMDKSLIEQPNQVELPPLDSGSQQKQESGLEGATDGANADCSKPEDSENGQNTYYIKWINFKNKQVPIITQNANGPCPLLAIVNVLFLKGKMTLAPMVEMISCEQLMTYLGEHIIESKPKNLPDASQANYEQNMQDGINIMCKLQTGLDVNVKFKGVDDFEYTPECIIFDLLEIQLYHGWLVDPQDSQCVNAIGKLSYNQIVEKIITQKNSEKEEDIREALVVEQFLDRSASQLTYHGLCELSNTVKDDELCVFFRNNHFTTLYKQNRELFLLVTDQGFLTETNVVWETLSNVEGDCHFIDANFRTYTKPEPSTHTIPPPNVAIGSEEQIDHDYLVALSLQQDQPLPDSESTAWGSYEKDSAAIAQDDHAFAVKLQEEEDRRAAAVEEGSQQRAAVPPHQAASGQLPIPRRTRERDRERERQREKDSCAIL